VEPATSERANESPGASNPLPPFAVVDIETSGLSVRRHRILQVAVVTVENGAICDEWSTLVRLKWPWQGVGPRRVHGIRRADLRGAPRPDEALAELGRHLTGKVFVAHNVGFDWPFIQRGAERARVQLPTSRQLCTLHLSRRLDPERQLSHRLTDVADRYGIVNDRPHDALNDARTTALLLPHLLVANGAVTAPDLEPLYDRR